MLPKQKITIGVTGLNNIDSPGPGIPVIRGLKESDVFEIRIVGLAYETLEPGIYMRDLVDKTYIIPYPSGGKDALLERLEYIHHVEKIDVIIPNFDAELYSFIKLEPELKAMGIAVFLPTLEQNEERHKTNLPEYGKKYGINVPESIEITNVSQVEKAAEKLKFPLMVKGKYYDAYVAAAPEQVNYYFSKIAEKWGLPIILQKFVKGTEVNVIALGDGKGNTIAAVPMRKQYITDKGKAWGGITLDDERMVNLAKHIIKQTKWRGGMELELVRDANNEFYLIEINPRIPAWVYLAVGAGQNIPEALVKLALGMPVEPYTKYDVGKMFIRYSFDMIVDLKEFEALTTKGEY
jgi:carbamoyl-phosphate synthase large subunit